MIVQVTSTSGLGRWAYRVAAIRQRLVSVGEGRRSKVLFTRVMVGDL